MNGLERPLSPFLVYRWQITNTLSIIHRMTGLALSLGLLVLSCWFIALASGPEEFSAVQALYASTWFKIPLIGWTFCFFYHLGNGIRHLFWDVGLGFGHRQIRLSGWAVVAFAVLSTITYAAAAIL
jgi:succinate dehydrogenase / fumarate reductase, cytochrome b subunit